MYFCVASADLIHSLIDAQLRIVEVQELDPQRQVLQMILKRKGIDQFALFLK